MDEPEQIDESAHLRRLLDEAKQNEREARRAVRLLNAVFKSLPVGVSVQSDDGATVLQNDLASEFAIAAVVRREPGKPDALRKHRSALRRFS